MKSAFFLFALLFLLPFYLQAQEVATFVNKGKPAGEYEAEFSTNNLQLTSGISAKGGYVSGVYFYRLQAGDFVETKNLPTGRQGWFY